MVNSAARMPGSRHTAPSVCRAPAPGADSAGKASRAHTSRPTLSSDISANAQRQPMVCPSNVPAGMPSDNASGVPTIATAMARPCNRGATMRLA